MNARPARTNYIISLIISWTTITNDTKLIRKGQRREAMNKLFNIWHIRTIEHPRDPMSLPKDHHNNLITVQRIADGGKW